MPTKHTLRNKLRVIRAVIKGRPVQYRTGRGLPNALIVENTFRNTFHVQGPGTIVMDNLFDGGDAKLSEESIAIIASRNLRTPPTSRRA